VLTPASYQVFFNGLLDEHADGSVTIRATGPEVFQLFWGVQQQAAPQAEAPRNRGWKDVDPYAPYTKMMGPFGF
jgi:hypothetical protein